MIKGKLGLISLEWAGGWSGGASFFLNAMHNEFEKISLLMIRSLPLNFLRVHILRPLVF
jgi:hypothetical protein